MKNAIWHEPSKCWLKQGSTAYELAQTRQTKKLADHMKLLAKLEKALIAGDGTYRMPDTTTRKE
jgi:hypothetical protein